VLDLFSRIYSIIAYYKTSFSRETLILRVIEMPFVYNNLATA
jgi:hypothetical protein